eukprot:gene34850-42202_t
MGVEVDRTDYLQNLCVSAVLALYIYLGTHELTNMFFLVKVLVLLAFYTSMHTLWNFLDIHKRYGPWKCSEPKSHYNFAIKSVWIVGLYAIGNEMIEYVLSIAESKKVVFTLWELADEYKIFSSKNFGQDIAWAIGCFYFSDFLRYWAHRIGHWAFFYKTFPFSHAHHHNQLFINPLTTIMSPMLHLASWASYLPCFLLGIYGLQRAAIIAWGALVFPSVTQHLGFDPFPWLTRINHYYFCGALPWIPLYHSYHHNPFIKSGNFGNSSVLFDYLFDTVQPESIYHIEHGVPPPELQERFKDQEKLGKLLHSGFYAGKGKNRLDLNDGYDSNMFKTYLL